MEDLEYYLLKRYLIPSALKPVFGVIPFLNGKFRTSGIPSAKNPDFGQKTESPVESLVQAS